MQLSTRFPSFLLGLSLALASPIDNAIDITPSADLNHNDTRAQIEASSLTLSSNHSDNLGSISPLFRISNPVVLQIPLRPIPVYMTAIGALVMLAKRDYDGQQKPFHFSEYLYSTTVSIGLRVKDGPSTDRKFAIWGIFLATTLMSRSGIFNESIFAIGYNNALVGAITIGRPGNPRENGEDDATSGNATGTALVSKASNSASISLANSMTPSAKLSLEPEAAVKYTSPVDLQTSQKWDLLPNNLSDVTDARKVSIRYVFYGETILPNNVYFTIMDALANTELPTYPASEPIPHVGLIDERMYNTHFIFKEFTAPRPPRRGPQWSYGFLYDGLKCIAEAMIDARTFREINATVLVGSGRAAVPVGEIFFKFGPPAGLPASMSVATS